MTIYQRFASEDRSPVHQGHESLGLAGK